MIQERIIKAKGSLEEGDFYNERYACRQVSNREPQLQRFAKAHDVILFVSGKKSSNGKLCTVYVLLQIHHSYFISDATEINPEWLEGIESVGICGATRTPMWLMEK